MKTIQATVREGESLLLALYREGRFVRASCGGRGRCRGCRVRLVGEERRRNACEIREPGEYRLEAAHPIELAPAPLPATPATGRDLGLAVDLGTTTLAAVLTDRATGEVLAGAGGPNPQIAYGADVLSRAGFATDEDHRRRIADLARQAIRALLAETLGRSGQSPRDVRVVNLAGNAAMTVLFLGRDPGGLLDPPYEPGLSAEGVIEAPGDPLGLGPEADVRFLPAIGGHVGSDTTAALLASGLLDGERPALLVDLGTNGEVVLVTERAVLAASSAAGPAFEGSGVSKGSVARAGAIERVEVGDGALTFRTVAGSPPTSWCGSGVLDIVAALREVGDLDATGRLSTSRTLPVPFTQADVREVQLAKGAVAAAITILTREAGMSPGGIRRAVLTGAFGSHLLPASAGRIGLLPPGVPVQSVQAGALAGAVLSLSLEGLEQATRIGREVRNVPLAEHEDFQEVFVAGLSLAEMSDAGAEGAARRGDP